MLSKAIGDLAATRPPFAHEELFASPICVAAKAESRKPSDSSGRPSPHPMAALGMAELSLDRDDPGGAIPVAKCCDIFLQQTRLSGPSHLSSP